MIGNRYDAVIIGGGVVGAAIAREISRYELNVCLLEKAEDVCSGTSKANSAIVHAGFDAVPGTKKAEFNVKGNEMMDELARDLEFEFKRNGSVVLCFAEEDLPKLQELYDRGIANGVKNLEIVSGDKIRELEPNVTDTVVAALLAPTGGIVCPFGLTIALAENAADNGVEFKFNTEVTGVKKDAEGYVLETNNGEVYTKTVINAAGVYSDEIHTMVSETKLKITPRKGDYCLLDKEAGTHVSRTIFQLPGKYGKGILVSPTVHGNLLLGPTAVDVEDKDNTATTAVELADAMAKSAISVKDIPYRLTITSFSGVRAHEATDDFTLGEVSDAPGFFDAAGIESPGLSSAPAIAEMVVELLGKAGLTLEKKSDFNPIRPATHAFREGTIEEKNAMIAKDATYGHIICRCEGVSEGEILAAIRQNPRPRDLDGVKRRTRAQMGRCQGGFCSPYIVELLAQEMNIPYEDVTKCGGKSRINVQKTKGGAL